MLILWTFHNCSSVCAITFSQGLSINLISLEWIDVKSIHFPNIPSICHSSLISLFPKLIQRLILCFHSLDMSWRAVCKLGAHSACFLRMFLVSGCFGPINTPPTQCLEVFVLHEALLQCSFHLSISVFALSLSHWLHEWVCGRFSLLCESCRWNGTRTKITEGSE